MAEPSGRESFRWTAILPEATKSGWKSVADMPVKHFDMHAAMNTHLSQPTGAGAFEGQHGMSFAISSVVAAADIFGIACIDVSEDGSAMTGRETGTNARPAIKSIASTRRIMKLRFTGLKSHKFAPMESTRLLPPMDPIWPALISIKPPRDVPVQGYLSDRPITAISSDIFAR
jgi:hypothetical protein